MYAQRAAAALRAALPPSSSQPVRYLRPAASERFASAGPEPSIHELLDDPIFHLLLARDRLEASDVSAFLLERRDAFQGSLCLCRAAA
jgi:hypothetical protein